MYKNRIPNQVKKTTMKKSRSTERKKERNSRKPNELENFYLK